MRKSGLRLLLVLAVFLPATLIGGPAHASYTDGLSGLYGTSFVDGADALTDDWGDHYGELGNDLCNGCADSMNSDLVLMWQAILYVEGFLTSSGLDGDFGPNTANATKSWQTRYRVTADGRVGAATWAKADDQLYWYPISDGWMVRYRSSATGRSLEMSRGSSDRQDGGAYSLYGTTNSYGDVTAAFFPQFTKVGFYQHSLRWSPVPCLC
jgi:Putative peptidoglycan binding domain